MTAPSSNLSNEIEEILNKVWSQANLNAIDSMSDRRELAGTVVPKAKARLTTLFNKQIVEAKLKLIDEWLGRTERFPNGYYGVSTVELAHKQAELKKELE